ncbi:MAG: hypothetical protein H6537_08805 [Bacteroidales bacterium]|nr:hypothetical protein [Bacteroidales bacterium]HRX31344.1 contractile injection system tape measure protein [Tenuifilaceae bacterium]
MSEKFHINNSGLALCNPFIPKLFSLLELTSENRFKDSQSAERAVMLLQYLLFKNSNVPEQELTFNKLLCGIAPSNSISCNLNVNSHEIEIMQQMLEGIIQYWKHLGKTSVQGLIEAFLIRGGDLELVENSWQLNVEQLGFDVLLDSLPWSYSPIKFAWMNAPIFVNWR